VGKSGQLLDIALEKAGIDRSKAYITNALRCIPTKNAQGSYAPSKDAINSCRERLAEEILAHPRKLILTLGNSAARSFIGDHSFKITSRRGLPIDLDEIGVWMPAMHPAAILRNQSEYPRWVGDLEYAGRILNGGREAVKRPPRPTAHVLLLEPGEQTFYPFVRELVEGGRVTSTDFDIARSWGQDISQATLDDGSFLPDWPVTQVSTGIPAAVRVVNGLLGKPVLSADIETGYSYSPRMGKVLALSVAFSDTDAVVFSQGLMESRGFRPHLVRLLTAPGPLWVGHNFKYDSSYLRHQILGGVWPDDGALTNYHDTLLEHYTLDEAKGTHDLEKLSRDFLGAVDYKNTVRKYAVKANKAKDIDPDLGYENVPREILYPYAALDTCHTFALHEILCPRVHASKSLARLYEQLLLPASRFLQRVQDYGLYVNQPYIDIIEKQLSAKMEEAAASLEREVAPYWDVDEYMASQWGTKKTPDDGKFNPRNYRHTSFVLWKLIGWVPMNTNERTLRDLDQTGKDQSATFGYKAKNYARGHPNRKVKLNYPFIQALIDARLAGHAYNMLVNGTKRYTEPDGRMHSTFNLQATETGRLSSTNPNLQNLPVPEKDDPLPARDIVGAPPGRVIMEADYSQVELRLLAHFSKDTGLIEVYKEGRDLHTELSIAIWGERTYDADGKQVSGYTNYQRVRAKAVNFGIAYGRGAGSIAAEHDIPIEEAEEMRQAWFRRFAQAAVWLDELHRSPLIGRTVISPFGRRRRFGVVSRDNYVELKNQSANFPMQSTASDLTLYSAMRMQEQWDRDGVDAHVVCLVHDAIVVECPEETADERSAELRAMMEDTPRRVLGSAIAFPVDVHIGRAWGTLKLEEMTSVKQVSASARSDTFGKAGVASGKL
jgi:uracil-DNA glycosylase family 4